VTCMQLQSLKSEFIFFHDNKIEMNTKLDTATGSILPSLRGGKI